MTLSFLRLRGEETALVLYLQEARHRVLLSLLENQCTDIARRPSF